MKALYTENEAALELGVTVDGLRTLVKQHIMANDEDAPAPQSVCYQPSDLVLLRLLAGRRPEPEPVAV